MGLSLKERLSDEYIAPCEGGEVFIYSAGPFCMSVCAPGDLSGEKVAAAVEAHHPCGTEGGWMPSSDETFKGGEPNPCTCEESPDRKHWLLDA